MTRARPPSRTVTSGRRPTARAGLVIVLAILVLAGTVLVRPPHAPPLYDGVGFPDEPYRWVVPPQGERRTPLAPTEAFVRLPVSDGVSPAGKAESKEQGPQIALTASGGTFAVPAEASTIALHAIPQAVPGVKPEHGKVVSNLYALTADANGRAVPVAPEHGLVVTMRAVRRTAQAVVICRWTGSSWKQVPTDRMGVDVYAGWLDTIGPVALVQLDPGADPQPFALDAQPAASEAGPGARGLWLGLGMIVVLLAGGLLILRRRTAAAGRTFPRPP